MIQSSQYAASALDLAIGYDGLHWFSGHQQRKWIIIHGTAGGSSAQGIAEYFKTVPSSVHYVVGQAGDVVQCVAEEDSAWGNGPLDPNCDYWWKQLGFNPNMATFSIEHVKPSTDNGDAITFPQREASFKLVAHLCSKWGIPTHMADANGGITGHYSLMPVIRQHCPGPYPFGDLIQYLKGNVSMLPAYVHDDGQALHYDGTNVTVQWGFREAILSGAVPWMGPVRTPELDCKDVRFNGTGLNGHIQIFEYGVLCWERQAGKIYALQSGDLLYALAQNHSSVDALHTALTDGAQQPTG